MLIDCQWNANGMPIDCQWNVTRVLSMDCLWNDNWLPIECHLTANGVSLTCHWNANRLPIECQSTANGVSINCHWNANWLTIEYQLTVNSHSPANALPLCHCKVTVSMKIHLNQISLNRYQNMPMDCQFVNAMPLEPLLCHFNHWSATQGVSIVQLHLKARLILRSPL